MEKTELIIGVTGLVVGLAGVIYAHLSFVLARKSQKQGQDNKSDLQELEVKVTNLVNSGVYINANQIDNQGTIANSVHNTVNQDQDELVMTGRGFKGSEYYYVYKKGRKYAYVIVDIQKKSEESEYIYASAELARDAIRSKIGTTISTQKH